VLIQKSRVNTDKNYAHNAFHQKISPVERARFSSGKSSPAPAEIETDTFSENPVKIAEIVIFIFAPGSPRCLATPPPTYRAASSFLPRRQSRLDQSTANQ
jgi:hypothetical protein